MNTATITARLAADGLQQHLFAAPSTVSEACKGLGQSCWSSGECCSGWCNWLFHCAPK